MRGSAFFSRLRLPARLAGSGLVLGAATIFLLQFGPRPPVARADIYYPIVRAAGFPIQPAGERSEVSEPRPIWVNGQPFHYTVAHAAGRLSGVLDHYERLLRSRLRLHEAIAVETVSRFEGPAMGYVGGIRLPSSDPMDLQRRHARMMETGRLSDLGQLHAVVGFANPGGVTVLHFIAGSELRLDQLFPTDGREPPGGDIEPVGRPPDARRLMTIDQAASVPSRIVFYSTRTPDAHRAMGFGLTARGWEKNVPFERESGGKVLHFVRATDECFMTTIPEGGGTEMLVIVYRGRPA